MNKVIKSMVAIVLAVTMMFSGAVSAFAASDAGVMDTLKQAKQFLIDHDVKGKLAVAKGEAKELVTGLKAEFAKLEADELKEANVAIDMFLEECIDFGNNEVSEMAQTAKNAKDELFIILDDAKVLLDEVTGENGLMAKFNDTVEEATGVLDEVEAFDLDQVKADFNAAADALTVASGEFTDAANEYSAAAEVNNIEGMNAAAEKMEIAQAKMQAASEKMKEAFDKIQTLEDSLNKIPTIVDDMEAMINDVDDLVKEVEAIVADVENLWNTFYSSVYDLVAAMKKLANSGNTKAKVIVRTFETFAQEKLDEADDYMKAALNAVKNYVAAKKPAFDNAVQNSIPESVMNKIEAAVGKFDNKSEAFAEEVANILVKLAGSDSLVDGGKDTAHHILSWMDKEGRFPYVLDWMEVHMEESVRLMSEEYFTTTGVPVWPRAEAEEKPEEPEVKVLLGDANEDGVVDSFDAALVLKYDAEIDVNINLVNADVNRDGVVDSFDAAQILKYDAEMIESF